MPRYRTNVRMQRREGVFEQPFFVWYGCICGVITLMRYRRAWIIILLTFSL